MNLFFSGQETELNELSRLTESPGNLILITGKVGVGKTTLLKHFENRWHKKFSGGVYWFSGLTKDNEKGKEDLEKEIENLEEEIADYLMIKNGDHRLVVIDDIEKISNPTLIKFADNILNQTNASLVILGHPGKLSTLFSGKNTSIQYHTISLLPSPVSFLSGTVKSRIEQINNPSKKELYLKKINDNPKVIKGLLKLAPQNTLKAIDHISNAADKKFSTEQKLPASKQDIHLRKGKDWFAYFKGPAFFCTLTFFIIGQIFTYKPGSNLGRVLQKVGFKVEKEDFHPKSKHRHLTTSRLNFRSSPKVDKGNILTTLDKGEEVDIIKVDSGWAFVSYHDKTSNTLRVGWVFTKYLTSIEPSPPQPLGFGIESFPS